MLPLLFSLPTDVIRDQITPFIDLLSLVKLDSATLSKQHRSNLLSYVLRDTLLPSNFILYERCLFQWLIERGIQLIQVDFPPESQPVDIEHATPVLGRAVEINLARCNSLTNECVQRLMKHINPGLWCIVLDGCSWVTDETLQIVSDLHGNSLALIFLCGCPLVTDAGVAASMLKCDSIEDVKWDNSDQIGTLAMAALANHHIVTLSFMDCPRITEDSFIQFLQGNRNALETLTLKNEQLTDRSLLAIAEHCDALQSIDISENDAFTDVGQAAIIKSCQCLTYLRTDQPGSTLAVLEHLGAQISPELTELFLGSAPLLSDAHIAAITARASKLQSLRFGESGLITDRSLQSIAVNLPNVTNVSIQICSEVGFAGVEALVRGCPNLVTLQLGMLPKVCDKCLDVISTHCKDLIEFSVTDNDLITDKGVRNLAKKCTQLVYVDFDFTKVTNLAVEYLIHSCPKLQTVALGGRGAVSQSLQNLADKRKINLLLSEPDE